MRLDGEADVYLDFILLGAHKPKDNLKSFRLHKKVCIQGNRNRMKYICIQGSTQHLVGAPCVLQRHIHTNSVEGNEL
jgi:hypothetical protein